MTKYFFGKNVGILYEHFPRKFNAVQNGGVNEYFLDNDDDDIVIFSKGMLTILLKY